MNVTKAKAIAVRESGMHRQGRWWVVSRYDPDEDRFYDDAPCGYRQARENLTAVRVEHVAEILHVNADYAELANECGGTLDNRVRLMLFMEAKPNGDLDNAERSNRPGKKAMRDGTGRRVVKGDTP